MNENKALADVVVLLGGKERRFALSLGVICAFKRESGIDLTREISADGIGIEEVTTLIYLLLKQSDPEITLDEIKEQIDLRELPLFMAAFAQAFEAAKPSQISKGLKKNQIKPETQAARSIS
jgi:hypothetical protein